jgi:SNF2 family DNA or RNA helicase
MEHRMYVPHTEPFQHQAELFDRTKGMENYALFWEQGCGKTKPTIDTMAHLWTEGEIDGAVVVAPNGVHRNWITDELPTHLPPELQERMRAHAYHPDTPGVKYRQEEVRETIEHRDFALLAISYEAWQTDMGKKAVWKMMRKRKVLCALDESHRVKTPSAKSTRSILAGGKHAPYRRILSGTPVPNGPFDIYSQVAFLDPDFWRRELDIDTFTAFKSYFGVWDTGYRWDGKKQVEYPILSCYNNLEELYRSLKLISSRVTKDDVLDLPEKLFSKRYYEMTPAQRRIYQELEEEFMAFLDSGEVVAAPLAIVRLLRMQQVLCGYVPVEAGQEPVELIDRANNPRLKAHKEVIEDTPGKAITWAVWTRDIDMVMDSLIKQGRKPVRYDGTCSSDQLQRAKDEFKKGDATDFVANLAMSEGLTLNEAKTTIYFNNNYNLRMRLQSEDRNHRIGQDDHVTYYDLVCPGTRDENAIAALVKKLEVAQVILGDKAKNWIES